MRSEVRVEPRERGRVDRVVVGFARQSVLLTQRQLHDGLKDPRKVSRMLGLKLMIGLLVGIIWLNDGRTSSFSSIFTTTGALFLVVNNAALDVLQINPCSRLGPPSAGGFA